MAYGDFTLSDVRHRFGVVTHYANLHSEISSISISTWLQQSLDKGRMLAFPSEKARCEFIVAPILIECQEHAQPSSIQSGVRLDVDAERGLKGECDFLLGRSPQTPDLQAPLLVVVEAKKNDIEEALGQCAAQMIGARIFNEREQNPIPIIHGCVTNANEWQFLRLDGSQLGIDRNRYYVNDVPKLVGIIVSILRG